MKSRASLVLQAATVAASLVLTGCAGVPALGPVSDLATGTLPPAKAATDTKVATEKVSATPAAIAAAAPPSKVVALARDMRAKGDRLKALSELEKAQRSKPADREISREIGFIALELGQLEKARKGLEAGLDPASPDWQTLSALGTAQASAGKQKEAQAHFKRALDLKPGHQPTLNNLALSYALDGDLAKAEAMLKSAAKGEPSREVKENLALVLALAGKYDAAEKVAGDVMPKAKVAANLTYLKSLTQKGG